MIRKALVSATAAVCILILTASAVLADWGLTLLTNPYGGAGTQLSISSFHGHTDGQDVEIAHTPNYQSSVASVLVRKVSNSDGWNGSTGWYTEDIRSNTPFGSSKVFSDIYVWANDGYTSDRITLGWYWYSGQLDPGNWMFTMKLQDAPDGINYSGPTTWNFAPSPKKTASSLLVSLPVFIANDGLQGYRFQFTAVHLVPEPSGLAALSSATALVYAVLRRRRRQF